MSDMYEPDDLEAPPVRKTQPAEHPEPVDDIPVWALPDAPAGSTEGSLMVYERGKAVRVSRPTHYHHLSDGRVVTGYSGGTHHHDADTGRVTKILSIHEG